MDSEASLLDLSFNPVFFIDEVECVFKTQPIPGLDDDFVLDAPIILSSVKRENFLAMRMMDVIK